MHLFNANIVELNGTSWIISRRFTKREAVCDIECRTQCAPLVEKRGYLYDTNRRLRGYITVEEVD